MDNRVSEGKRRAHAARRRREAEQQLLAERMTPAWRSKVEVMVRRALYRRLNPDEHHVGDDRKPRALDDIVQLVLLEFARHPDWLSKGDGYLWRTINFKIGHYFRARGNKLGIGTRRSHVERAGSFVDLLAAPDSDEPEDAAG